MKKVFKWIWYNKEQLISIIYSVAVLVLASYATWSDTLNGYVEILAGLPVFAYIGGDMAVKVTAIVLAVGATILSIRNICVKYGLSSLETIDEVLAEKAAKKKNKLTSEQKKQYKALITTLQGEFTKITNELKTAETELAKITEIYNADNHLVSDYTFKKQMLEKKINANKASLASIENKVADYKAILKGTKSAT